MGGDEGKQYTTDDLKEMVESGAICEIPWRLIQRFEGQPRKHFNKARLEALGRSISKKGQIKPGEVRVRWGGVSQQFELVDGERRWRACQLLDIPFRAWVVDIKDVDEQYARSFISNLHRDGHTPLETAAAVERIRNSPGILALKKGEQLAAVADEAGKSITWVKQYLSLARLVPSLRRLLEPGVKKKDRLPLVLAFRIATLPRDEQLPAWEAIRRQKLSNRQAQRHIDKTILDKGLDKHRRGLKPSDELDLMLRLVRRTERDSSDVLALSNQDLGRVVADRTDEQRRHILQELDMARTALDRIHQRLRQAMKENPPAAKPN